MEMRVSGSQLILTGFVSGQDYNKFMSSLTPAVRTVVLTDSPGGAITIGLYLAHEIRRRGLSTVALGHCGSSCANMFLGGIERRLANSTSYVAFHGHYTDLSGNPSSGKIGELRTFYSEMTSGKLTDEMIKMFVSKRLNGSVVFYKSVTRNCEGTEEHRPQDCPTLPVTALELGILTSLDDVEVNQQQ